MLILAALRFQLCYCLVGCNNAIQRLPYLLISLKITRCTSARLALSPFLSRPLRPFDPRFNPLLCVSFVSTVRFLSCCVCVNVRGPFSMTEEKIEFGQLFRANIKLEGEILVSARIIIAMILTPVCFRRLC